MDWGGLPEWLKAVVVAGLSSLGTIGLGVLRAWSDNKRVRSDDRSVFTQQVMDRLQAVEDQLQAERQYCEQRMQQLSEQYEQRLATRDQVIARLQNQVDQFIKGE